MIGSSTGGPLVLEQVVGGLPRLRAAIVIVQHIPGHFVPRLRDNLQQGSAMEVRVATDGDRLLHGRVYLAPSGLHLRLGPEEVLELVDGDKVNYVRPSIDVAMCSIRAGAFARVAGVVLTGMGRDGARGLAHVRSIGGRTIVQDPSTCAIGSMPETAIAEDAVDQVLTPDGIRAWLERTFG